MFALWVFVAMTVCAAVSGVLFFIAPTWTTTWWSEAGAWSGLASLFFAAVLAVMGANWVIQLGAVALGF